jgi:hypothetical protein
MNPVLESRNQAVIEGASKYEIDSCKDAYARGFDRGYSCASWQDVPELGATLFLDGEGRVTVEDDNVWDVVQSLAYMGESNDRSYSPFEFTAKEFNDSDNSEALWEAFDSGIADGISRNITERQTY